MVLMSEPEKERIKRENEIRRETAKQIFKELDEYVFYTETATCLKHRFIKNYLKVRAEYCGGEK